MKFHQMTVDVGPISEEFANALERTRKRMEDESKHDMQYGLSEEHGHCSICERRRVEAEYRNKFCGECGKPYEEEEQ